MKKITKAKTLKRFIIFYAIIEIDLFQQNCTCDCLQFPKKLQRDLNIMKTKDKIVVGFVWGIIIFQTTVFLTLFAPSLYTHNFFVFIILIPIFLAVVTLLVISYYKSTVYPAGSPNFHVNTHYSDELQQIKQRSRIQSEKKKQRRKVKKQNKQSSTLQQIIQQIQSLKSVSFCFKCDVIKQERVHHCSICKKCILRMDHHCPWTGNCIGKLNHKYFILFLFYATTGLSMVAISITIDYLTGGFYADQLQTKTKVYIYYFACITSYMLALSIGFLFVTQMLTAINNLTTLQSFTQGIHQRNPWKSQSSGDNLRDIFGDSIWFLPTQPFHDPNLQASSILNSIDSL